MPSRVTKKLDTRNDPAQPLSPQREAFCAAICRGAKLQEAHNISGFRGSSHAAAWQLRHTPEVDARIRWLLKERVKAENARFARRQKMKGDLLERVVKELEAIAFCDIGEVVDLRKEPVLNDAGEVVEVRDALRIRETASMPAEARKAIKALFMKSGQVRIEMADKRAALETLARILKGDDAATSNVTNVTQVNVGAMSATDVAQRIAFLLAAAAARPPSEPLIEAQPIRKSSAPQA